MNAVGLALSWTVLYLGGFGLGPAVPPQPELPLMAKIAPAECLFYMSAAAEATPEASSQNQTEQLLAEPEVGKLMTELDRMMMAGMVHAMQGAGAPNAFSAEEIVNLLKVPKNCSLAVYVSEFEPRPEGPVIRGGAVLKISGNDSAKETLEKALGRLAPAGAESVESQASSGIAPRRRQRADRVGRARRVLPGRRRRRRDRGDGEAGQGRCARVADHPPP